MEKMEENLTIEQKANALIGCAKIGDTYKCANGKSFGETCDKQNCPIIK